MRHACPPRYDKIDGFHNGTTTQYKMTAVKMDDTGTQPGAFSAYVESTEHGRTPGQRDLEDTALRKITQVLITHLVEWVVDLMDIRRNTPSPGPSRKSTHEGERRKRSRGGERDLDGCAMETH
jgi:hypothetical protein